MSFQIQKFFRATVFATMTTGTVMAPISGAVARPEPENSNISQFDSQQQLIFFGQTLAEVIVPGSSDPNFENYAAAIYKSLQSVVSDTKSGIRLPLYFTANTLRVLRGLDQLKTLSPEDEANTKIQSQVIARAIFTAYKRHVQPQDLVGLTAIAMTKILDEAGKGEFDSEVLAEKALDAVYHNLDPHSDFMTALEVERLIEETRAQFVGIGVHIAPDSGKDVLNQGLRVLDIMDVSSPAFNSGLQPGDLITHVDGASLAGLTVGDAASKVRGTEGSTVKLTVVHDGQTEPLVISVVRANVIVNPVSARIVEEAGIKIGYVRLSAFNQQTGSNIDRALRQLLDQGAEKFILDLRNNPGGLVNAAAHVAGNLVSGEEGMVEALTALNDGETLTPRQYRLIRNNTIISMRDRNGKSFDSAVTPGDIIAGRPLVVLVNSYSASASELVAGVLQNYDRAVVIGTQTFGKGSAQAVIPLNVDGDEAVEGALRLTESLYYVGSGEGWNIQGRGITPNIRISVEFGEVAAAPSRTEAALRHVIPFPDDANYNVETTAECKPEKPVSEEVPPAYLSPVRPGVNAPEEFDAFLACAVDFLTEGEAPYAQIEPLAVRLGDREPLLQTEPY